MKKRYQQPAAFVTYVQPQHLLTGTGGPNSGDQGNPGMGGARQSLSGLPHYDVWDDNEGDYEE
jgi:hypothetical protein